MFKLRCTNIAVLFLVICLLVPQSALALGIPLVGQCYSFGNWLSGQSDDPNNPWVITEGWGWVLDPPTDNSFLSGRVTLKFDPSWTVGGVGWLGEFGEDPALPAPQVEDGIIRFDSSLLQPNANTEMVSSNITIDQSNGLAVFEFNWGTPGFIPTLNLSSSGHFNFAAILFTDPLVLPADELVTPFGAGSIAPYGIVGNPYDHSLGTNAPTYLQIIDGSTGETHFCCIPEPATLALLGTGLIGLAGFKRKKKHNI